MRRSRDRAPWFPLTEEREPPLTTIIVLVVVALLVGLFVFSYNKLVKLRVRADEAFSGIDVGLKRRAARSR